MVAIVLAIGCGTQTDPKGLTLSGIKERGEITWGADIQGGEPFVYENPDKPTELVAVSYTHLTLPTSDLV